MTLASDVVAELARQGLGVAVAESLTGGLLVAALTAVPGASVVVRGGVVAYATDIKHSILGVSAELLAEHGPVHPEVARQMATGVRRALGESGRPADVGVATTGVAGPTSQGGHPPGTVYLGIATEAGVEAIDLQLLGTRDEIRANVVVEALKAVMRMLERDAPGVSPAQ